MFAYKFMIDSKLFEQKSAKIGRQLRDFVRVTGKEIARYAHKTVAAHTPPTRSGRTKIRDLWDMQHTRKGTIETFIIRNTYPNKEIILMFEKGSLPHVITPIRAPMLHWIDERTKQHIFAKSVKHPGTPPYKMVEQTEREVNILVENYIQKTYSMIDKIVKGG